MKQALEVTKTLPPQTEVEIMRGLTVRRTKAGIAVVRLHYSADPERDPEINPKWKEEQRKKYTSHATWDRDQEIIDYPDEGVKGEGCRAEQNQSR